MSMNGKYALGWIPDYPDFRDYTEETEEVREILRTTGLAFRSAVRKRPGEGPAGLGRPEGMVLAGRGPGAVSVPVPPRPEPGSSNTTSERPSAATLNLPGFSSTR